MTKVGSDVEGSAAPLPKEGTSEKPDEASLVRTQTFPFGLPPEKPADKFRRFTTHLVSTESTVEFYGKKRPELPPERLQDTLSPSKGLAPPPAPPKEAENPKEAVEPQHPGKFVAVPAPIIRVGPTKACDEEPSADGAANDAGAALATSEPPSSTKAASAPESTERASSAPDAKAPENAPAPAGAPAKAPETSNHSNGTATAKSPAAVESPSRRAPVDRPSDTMPDASERRRELQPDPHRQRVHTWSVAGIVAAVALVAGAVLHHSCTAEEKKPAAREVASPTPQPVVTPADAGPSLTEPAQPVTSPTIVAEPVQPAKAERPQAPSFKPPPSSPRRAAPTGTADSPSVPATKPAPPAAAPSPARPRGLLNDRFLD
jgi:hypothetical protein